MLFVSSDCFFSPPSFYHLYYSKSECKASVKSVLNSNDINIKMHTIINVMILKINEILSKIICH